MDDQLQLLSELNDLLAQVPTSTADPVSTIWDNLVSQIKKLVSDIVNNAKNTIVSWISGVKSAVTSRIDYAKNILKGWIDNTATTIKTTIYTVRDYIAKQVTSVKDTVTDAINNTFSGIGDAIKYAVGWIRDKLQGIISTVRDIGNSIGASIKNALANVAATLRNIGNSIGASIKNALANVGTIVGDAVKRAIEGASSWIKNAIDTVKTTISNIIDSLKNTVTRIVETVGGWVKNVGDAIKNAIQTARDWITDAFETARDWIADKISIFITWIQEVIARLREFFYQSLDKVTDWFTSEVLPRYETFREGAEDFISTAEKAWALLEAGDYEGAIQLWNDFAEGLGIPAPIEILRTIMSAITYFYLSIELRFVPLRVAAEKNANIGLGLDPVSLESASLAVYRGDADLDKFYANARLAGVTKSRADLILSATKAIPTPGSIQDAFLRGLLDEDEHDKMLSYYGFSEDDIKLFKALYFFIPPAQDLIRMSIREAFTPEIAEKFGQFENFPDVFAEFAAQQGISKEWALRYWASHWDLPSPQMGFEMLHRGIIDEDELKLLLRALDVMPYWRERLIKLSYNPFTRVDVRRMYKFGVLTEDEVYQSYLDLGYSPEKASYMLEFTKRYSAPEDESEQDEFRALAKTAYSQAYKKRIISEEEYSKFLTNMGYHPDDVSLLVTIDTFILNQSEKLFDYVDYRKDWQKIVLKAYDRGLIGTNETVDMLVSLGYEKDEATLEINLVDYNRQLVLRDILTKQIGEQYVEWTIDETRVFEVLNTFGFTSNETDKLIEEWNIERTFRTRKPSITDLTRFLKAGLLSVDDFLDELRGLGYSEKYIPLYKKYLTA